MSRVPQLMLGARAAEYLGIGRNTLTRWNRQGIGPPRTLKGKRYWYSREMLKEWIRAGLVEPAIEPVGEPGFPQFGKPPRLPNGGTGRVHR